MVVTTSNSLQPLLTQSIFDEGVNFNLCGQKIEWFDRRRKADYRLEFWDVETASYVHGILKLAKLGESPPNVTPEDKGDPYNDFYDRGANEGEVFSPQEDERWALAAYSH